MSYTLRIAMTTFRADADPAYAWLSSWIGVTQLGPMDYREFSDLSNACLPKFELMCSAIRSDIQNAQGSGRTVQNWIQKVEQGELDLADVDGNAWVMNITKDKVWFEGLYSQGEGGEVSFEQFKLAVRTYIQFLTDPEHKTIEIEFPDA